MDNVAEKYLGTLGYSQHQINKIIRDYSTAKLIPSTLYTHIKENYKCLQALGYSHNNIVKITVSEPSIYDYNIDSILMKIREFMNMGYTKEEVVKMTNAFPCLFTLSASSMRTKMDYMIKLGYSKEQFIHMTVFAPAFYSYTIDNITDKISFIQSLGYTKEESIAMTCNLPILFGLSKNNISEKVRVLKEINIDSVIVKDTKILMQSSILTKARYDYLAGQNMEINDKNYKYLFAGAEVFKSKFGVSKDALLNLYDKNISKGESK